MENGHDPGTSEYTVALKVSNTRDKQVVFWLEPWGETVPMEPKDTFDVVANGPPGHALQVDYGENSITVYAWPGSIAAAFHNGVEIAHGVMRVPSVGPNLSVKGFLDVMFGNLGK